jgi:hypothetical protein
VTAVFTRWRNLLTPEGEAGAYATWDELFDRMASADVFRGDNEHPGWSPATFNPCKRSKDNVRAVHALCLDYDGGTQIADALERWAGHYGYLHTTRRHTDEAPRFRVILPLARSVSPFEFQALWHRVNVHAGGKLDPAPKDPSRFWFWPSCNGDGEYIDHRLDGEALDPDEWLARPEPAPERPTPTQPSTDVEKRAVAYVDRMPPAIAGAGGHQATWAVAVTLAKGFSLSESATLRILLEHFNPRCEPPWSERELEHKARDASNAKLPEGYLLNDDRGWEAHRHVVPRAPVPETERAPEKPAHQRYGLVTMRDLMLDVVRELQKPRPEKGCDTGSGAITEAIGGFRRGNVTVFGAKRGFGKTSYGNMVASLAMPDKRVCMFAGEDSAAMYGRRFLASRANLNAMLLRDLKVGQGDMERIERAIGEAPGNPFFAQVAGRPVEWIAKAIRELGKEEQIDLVIVDYLQKLRTEKKLQDRRNEVTYVTSTLVDAIKSVGASGLLFSQLKRGERQEPEVEDLKESGDIEDMADHILLGWVIPGNPETGTHATRKIKIGKNKDGIEGSEIEPVTMGWDRRTASFVPTGSHANGSAQPEQKWWDS